MRKFYKSFLSKSLLQFTVASVILIALTPGYLYAQAPSISYGSSSYTLTAGTAFTITPTSSNVSPQGYSSHIDTIATRVASNYSFATDKDGFIYNAENGVVKKMAPAGGSPVVISSGINSLSWDLKLDTAGNIFVVYGDYVRKLSPTGGNVNETIISSSEISTIATDLSGNLYAYGNGVIHKILNVYSTRSTIFNKLTSHKGLTVDMDGNVYIINTTDKKVYKVTGLTTVSAVTSALTAPTSLAIDPGNNIYVADKTSIKQISADRTSLKTLVSGFSTGNSIAQTVTVDNKGNLIVATQNGPSSQNVYLQKIKPTGGYHLNRPLPAGLHFDNNTGIITGTTSARMPDIKYTVYAYNATGGVDSANISLKVISTNSNANLSGLELSFSTLNKKFNKDSLNYTFIKLPTEYASASNYFVVKPTTAEPLATIKINGVNAQSGVIFYGGNFDKSTNIYKVEVTAPDGITTKTYKLVGHRAQSEPAAMHLNVSGNPYYEFSSYSSPTGTVYQYNIETSYTMAPMILTPSVADPGATISYNNGIPITREAPGITIDAAGVGTIPIKVTWSNGEVREYTVVYSREIPNDMYSTISVDKGKLVGTGSFNYVDTVANNVTSIEVRNTFYYPSSVSSAIINGVPVNGNEPVTVPLNEHNTTIPVIITNGVLTYTYSIVVTRQPADLSADAALTQFYIQEGSVPVPDIGVNTYLSRVQPHLTSVQLVSVTSNAKATIKVNGITVASGTPVTVPLQTNSIYTTINTEVTAEDAATRRNYSMIVKKVSLDSSLTKLTLQGYNLTRIGTTDNYKVSVAVAQASVQLAAITANEFATLSINGLPAASGNPVTIALNPTGTTVVNTIVSAEDTTSKRTYTLTISRLGSQNASLTRLSASNSTLTHNGDDYTTSVPTMQSSIQQIAETSDSLATISVNGEPVASGSAYTAALNPAGPTTITTVVTAEDGVTTRTYHLIVNKNGSTNAGITRLALEGIAVMRLGKTNSFSTNNISRYQTSVQHIVAASDTNATIRVNGTIVRSGESLTVPIDMYSVETLIITTVTSEDGSVTRTFRLTVRRNYDLPIITSLNIVGQPKTQISTNKYLVTVSPTQTSVQLLAVSANNAYMEYYGTYSGGYLSSGVPVTVTLNATGPTVVSITVYGYAGDNTYTITINKTGSALAALTRLSLPGYTLTRVGTTDNYTTSADAGQSSVQQIATTGDAHATLKVNGVTAISGSPLTVALNATGATTLTTVVTAEDGVTSRVYTITVNKPAPRVMASATDDRQSIIREAALEDKPRTFTEAVTDIAIPQGLSPNGDGINDRFTIAGITAYPQNTVKIMNRNGDVIYRAEGYDNASKTFDGHDSAGILQKAGTYFYSVEYKDGSETKRKTGYLVIKY